MTLNTPCVNNMKMIVYFRSNYLNILLYVFILSHETDCSAVILAPHCSFCSMWMPCEYGKISQINFLKDSMWLHVANSRDYMNSHGAFRWVPCTIFDVVCIMKKEQLHATKESYVCTNSGCFKIDTPEMSKAEGITVKLLTILRYSNLQDGTRHKCNKCDKRILDPCLERS